MSRSTGNFVFLHPSDELYGADRMLLEMVAAIADGGRHDNVEVWLPTDLAHPAPHLALCSALADRGIQVRHVDLPILRRAYQTPAGLVVLLVRMCRLYMLLRRARPAVVYCTTSAAILGAPVARAARARRVVGHVQEFWSRREAGALALVARSCHTLLAISQAVAGSLPPTVRARVRVVPNGVGEPGATTSLAGRRGELTFLVASRWNGWKGHRTLLAAWEIAGAPGKLVVLGGPPRSGESVDVPALVAEHERPDAVRVVGDVEDPSSYVSAADVVIVPSDQPEPFGLVAIEAFAHGRPVIASAGGGLLDIVTPGQDGWLFPPTDTAALATLLAGLDRSVVESAGRRARETYEASYTADRFARDWRACVLGSPHPETEPLPLHP